MILKLCALAVALSLPFVAWFFTHDVRSVVAAFALIGISGTLLGARNAATRKARSSKLFQAASFALVGASVIAARQVDYLPPAFQAMIAVAYLVTIAALVMLSLGLISWRQET
jgi:hypothetical protein